MPIIPFDNSEIRYGGNKVITIDKNRRIYLNKPLQSYLNCKGKPIKLHLGYDPANRRIAIAKPEILRLTNHRPVTFSKYSFISARPFIERFKIPYEQGPLHYYYFGDEDGWMTFQLEGHIAEDEPGKGKAGYDGD